MKIAIIGADRADSMEFHLKDAFMHLGHDVIIFYIYSFALFKNKSLRPYAQSVDKFLRTSNDKYDARRFKTLSNNVKSFNPDLIVCLYKDIHPSFIDNVKSSSNVVIHVNPDQMTTLGYQQVFAGNYDAWFTKDKYMLRFMTDNMHLNTFPYTEAFNHRYNPKPMIEKPDLERELDIDVATYGTLYPYRTRMLGEIIRGGIDIKLYGVVPHRFFDNTLAPYCTGKYIVGEEKAKVLYGSRIVLNNLHFAEVESVNCRFFEANGCGAFQLCDYRPILAELLPVDPETVSFKDTNDAIDKIKYYLYHADERHEIANKIYSHFLEHYTYDHLAKYLLKTVSEL